MPSPRHTSCSCADNAMQLLPSALLCRSSKLHRGKGGGKEGSPQAAAAVGRGLIKEEEVEGMLWACGKGAMLTIDDNRQGPTGRA
jgi:hypothetical protein